MKRPAALVGLVLLCLCVGCGDDGDGGGSIALGAASNADFYGIWDGPTGTTDPLSGVSRVVWQFDPPADGAELGLYGIYHEVRSTGGRRSLALQQVGEWWFEDDHIVTQVPGAFEPFGNEVFALTATTMTMESAQSPDGQIAYTRAEGCPDATEREGWQTTSRELMALDLVTKGPGFMDVVTDSVGRVHIITGGSGCEGDFPCQPTGLPTTYFTRSASCLWHAYTVGNAFVQPSLSIDAADNLHIFARPYAAQPGAPWHMTAPADGAAVEGATAWTMQPAGALLDAVGRSGGERIEAEVDADGVFWAIEGVLDERSQGEPTLFRWDGVAWTAHASGFVNNGPITFEGDVFLAVDDEGVMRVVIVESSPETGRRQLRILSAEDMSAPPRVVLGPDPVAEDTGGQWADLLVDADGTVHIGCNYVDARQDGNHVYQACYGVYDGTAWSFTPLGIDRIERIERRGDGVMLVGDTIWWQDEAGVWRAPGPRFEENRVHEGNLEPFGLGVAAATWDPVRSVAHFASRTWYGAHSGFAGAMTDVGITFDGAGDGVVELAGAAENCTTESAADCSFAIDAGSVVELTVRADETSNFRGFALLAGQEGTPPFATPSGAAGLWATGERVDLIGTFHEGRAEAAASWDDLGQVLVAPLDDGSLLVAGRYGFRFPFGVQPEPPLPQTRFPFVMRLTPALGLDWFRDLTESPISGATGEVLDGLHVAGGDILVSGPGFYASLAAATGDTIWARDIDIDGYGGGEVHPLEGGGGVGRIGMRTPPAGFEWRGDDLGFGDLGLVVFDDTGTPTHGLRARGLPPTLSRTTLTVSGDRVWTIETDSGIDAHAIDTGRLFTLELGNGNGVADMRGDGAGGVWVGMQMNRPENVPSCDEDDGGAAFFHFDADGRCTFRGPGMAFSDSSALWTDGRGATLAGSVLMLRPGDPHGSQVDPPLAAGGQMGHTAWSPDGTRFAYSFLATGINPGDVPVGGVGVIRYRP